MNSMIINKPNWLKLILMKISKDQKDTLNDEIPIRIKEFTLKLTNLSKHLNIKITVSIYSQKY